MRCTSPRTVGFQSDGKTICWSPKKYSKEFASFQMPCGKCTSCRLISAQQTAIRCVHESQQHQQSCFITLTYSDENLKSAKLQYRDFQLFIKRLRSKIYHDTIKDIPGEITTEVKKEIREKTAISVFVTGEYGDRNQRPHWHALIFGWHPKDAKYHRSTDRGDRIYTSKQLDDLWGHNDSIQRPNEIGEITIESASYCARYATKKLYSSKTTGDDLKPLSRRSAKHAIGKKWIEKHWQHTFAHGYVTYKKGDKILKAGIPRYYEKWLQKNKPDEWSKWKTTTQPPLIQKIREKESRITLEERQEDFKRSREMGYKMLPVKKMRQMEAECLEAKIKQINSNLKI